MSRCAATLFLARHDVLMSQKRTADGALVRPHTLVWECQRCGRIVGETVTPYPVWSIQERSRTHDETIRD